MDTLEQTAPRPAWLRSNARAAILFNEKSGSVAAPDLDILVERLRAHGVDDVDVYDPGKMDELFTGKKSDFVVVLGGDGTARAVAASAPSDAPPLILLPGGTLNILPKALYGELAWQEALDAALIRGEVKRLIAGKANDELFFIAALFGAPSLLARVREAARSGAVLEAWLRFRHYMKRSFSKKIEGRPDDKPMRRAEAISVLCPPFSGEIVGEDLEWVRINPGTILDMLRMSMRALGGPGWRDDADVHTRRCKRGEVRGQGVIPAVLDGEPHTFLSRVRISYVGKGPRVIFVPHEIAAPST
jgi:diacylglycerol kinase family enzyme